MKMLMAIKTKNKRDMSFTEMLFYVGCIAMTIMAVVLELVLLLATFAAMIKGGPLGWRCAGLVASTALLSVLVACQCYMGDKF